MSEPLRAGVSGYSVVRNALSLDYCIEAVICSLLPVCNEVVVCDSDSTDGTLELLQSLAAVHPTLRIINYPWPSPRGRPTWFVEWINYARGHLRYTHQLMLDADEVLSDTAYDSIKAAQRDDRCLWFKRLNFWGDAQHIAPSGDGGVGVGDGVARFGRSEMWMPSDEPHPEGEPVIRQQALPSRMQPDATLNIYHYGFLRRNDAFIAKARVCLETWFATKDERIERAAREGCSWMQHVHFSRPLELFAGSHPLCAARWLTERGYHI